MDGWVKLYRKFMTWEWFKNSEMVHLFIYLLLSANCKDGKWQGQEIKRGQLITGRKELSANTKISEQSIRTCLKKLELTKEIVIKSTNKNSIITICNYESYQEIQNTTNQQLTNNQPTTNQQSTTNKKSKKSKEEKEIIYPELVEVEKYFDENGYTKLAALKFFNYYSVGDWTDKDGKKVISWKRKAIAVWFKPEYEKPKQSIPKLAL